MRSAAHRNLRQRASARDFQAAVRLAAEELFDFTHRAIEARALWCQREGVWLGQKTFLHWALNDQAFDIPWVVAGAKGASSADDPREAVQAELAAYWAEQLPGLPRKKMGAWLPLP